MNKIKIFFDKMAIDRNLRIAKNPIIEYEQIVRSQMVISIVDPQANELILDVGCGNARDLIHLSRTGCKCVGTDLSSNMIEEARKELEMNGISGVDLEVGDAINLSFPDETFNKVFASEVLEHIPNYPEAVSEMARVMKSGGTLVITTPNRHSMYGFDRYAIYERFLRKKWSHPYDAWKTYDEVASAIDGSGLRIVNVSGICYIPGFTITYGLPRFIKNSLLLFVGRLEESLSKAFPKNGYMLCIKAIKE